MKNRCNLVKKEYYFETALLLSSFSKTLFVPGVGSVFEINIVKY